MAIKTTDEPDDALVADFGKWAVNTRNGIQAWVHDDTGAQIELWPETRTAGYVDGETGLPQESKYYRVVVRGPDSSHIATIAGERSKPDKSNACRVARQYMSQHPDGLVTEVPP